MSSEEDVARYLRDATASFGQIDFHHLNAGIPGTTGAFPDLTADEFDRVLAVNLRSVFLCSLRATQVMARRHESMKSAVPSR